MPGSSAEEDLLLGFGGSAEEPVAGRRPDLVRRRLGAAVVGVALVASALCSASLRSVLSERGQPSAATASLASVGLAANRTESFASINGSNGTHANGTEGAMIINGSNGTDAGEQAGKHKEDGKGEAGHHHVKARREGHDQAKAHGHGRRKKAKFDPKKPWLTRRGSFFVIGDWGYDPIAHWENINNGTCQKAIAKKMLDHMEALGDVKFVLNVGDSFYPDGVKSKDDPQWDTKWRNIYDKKLRSVPWYSVYGNHDYHHDPCVCSPDPNDCAQVNGNISNLDYFQMPNHTWYKEYLDLGVEIIGMDLNKYMLGWNHDLPAEAQHFEDCNWSPCKEKCLQYSNERAGRSFDLFYERTKASSAKNLLVFSHYPTDYFTSADFFLDALSDNATHDIFYFGGHRHNTDQWSTFSTSPNVNWVVGGGGGWSCDGPQQGFVVGEIYHDYSIHTYNMLVDKDICCIPPPTSTSTATFTTSTSPWYK